MLGLGTSLSTAGAVSEVIPSDISGLQIWLKNNTDIAVGQWDDQSGYGRHAIQSNSDDQAAISGGGFDFSSVDPEDYYIFTEDTTAHLEYGGSNAFTIAAVITREGTAGDDNALIGGDGTGSYLALTAETEIKIQTAGVGGTTSTFNFGADTWKINTEFLFTATKDTSGDWLFYKNGTQQNVTSSTNPTNTGADSVVKFFGARNPGHNTGAMTFEGKIKELVIYNAQLTGDDLTNLNSYLTSKFGL